MTPDTAPGSTGYRLVFDENFEGDALAPERWFPFYLPHWSEPARTAPTYTVSDGALRLRIGADQPPWCPEHDGPVRVSSVQTGHWSGPVGSDRGQHRFKDGLVVRSDVPPGRLYTPLYGRLEMRARARLNPNGLVSLWMIGFEDEPHRSGEITLMEVFGSGAGEDTTVVGCGIKKVRDPALEDEFHETALPIRLSDWHVYAYDWTPDGVRFFVDGEPVSQCGQSPDYPMQIMLNIYELPDRPDGPADPVFEIDYVRGYEPTG